MKTKRTLKIDCRYESSTFSTSSEDFDSASEQGYSILIHSDSPSDPRTLQVTPSPFIVKISYLVSGTI